MTGANWSEIKSGLSFKVWTPRSREQRQKGGTNVNHSIRPSNLLKELGTSPDQHPPQVLRRSTREQVPLPHDSERITRGEGLHDNSSLEHRHFRIVLFVRECSDDTLGVDVAVVGHEPSGSWRRRTVSNRERERRRKTHIREGSEYRRVILRRRQSGERWEIAS